MSKACEWREEDEIPPYRSEGHKVLNTQGELVAVFEDRDEAIAAVSIINKRSQES